MLGEDTVMELYGRSEMNSHFWKLSLHFVYNNQHAIQCKPIISNIHGRWLSLKASTCQKIDVEIHYLPSKGQSAISRIV